MNRKSIVVCGAGDWVRKQYAPIVRRYCLSNEYEVVITYDSEYAGRVPGLSSQQREDYDRAIDENVVLFESWGAQCLDVSKRSNADRILTINPAVVFIVTPDDSHCAEAERWLVRGARMVIEKPLDADPIRATHFSANVQMSGASERVQAFDHYLTRAAPLYDTQEIEKMWEFVQNRIESWRFHMLEPSSDAELGRRVASIQHGMVMDMAPHAVALVAPFGNPAKIRVGLIKAATYLPNRSRGILTSGREVLRSGGETFAEVLFSFSSKFHQEVSGAIRIGKFVGGSNEKFLEIVGGVSHDRVVRFDFVSHGMYFGDGGRTRHVGSLEGQPVQRMIDEVVGGKSSGRVGLFSVAVGCDTILRVAEFRAPIVAHLMRGRPLDEYVAGSSAEDIVETLSPL